MIVIYISMPAPLVWLARQLPIPVQNAYKQEFCPQHVIRVSITYSFTCPHMHAANPQRCMCASNAGVNVCLPASGVDAGVQCDLIPLVTSTPNQSDESWEEDEVNLPQDQIADNHPPSLCSQFERPTKADAIKEHRTCFSSQ